jgi:hypothetical protein
MMKAHYYCPAAQNVYSVSDVGFRGDGQVQYDADGAYYYNYYDNSSNICRGRMYKVEWQLLPDRSSFPTSCIISGSSTIDFQGQTKNIVIKWP